MDNDLVKRLIWSALLAGLGALASIATQRVPVVPWPRVCGADPPAPSRRAPTAIPSSWWAPPSWAASPSPSWSSALAPDDPNSSPQIAAAIQEISDRATALVREEIELAKAEVSAKVNKLIRAAVVATVAGVFAVFGLAVLLNGFAWLLYELVFPANAIYWGFFVVAGALFVLAGLAAFLAARWFKRGAPPTPEMAIDEAQRIRETLSGEPGGQLEAIAARAEADGS